MTTRRINKFEVAIERITYTQAAKILEHNNENRKFKPRSLIRLKRALEADEFYLSPEAIHIGSDGTLFNGQHRLTALVETKKSALFIVLRGGGKEIQDITDDGTKRQPGDVLHISGVKNAPLSATAVRLITAYVNKLDPKRHDMTNREILEAYEIYERLDRSVSLAAKYNNYYIIPTTCIAAFHYLFATASSDDADEFFEKASTGFDLNRNNPILTLRNRLLRERANKTMLHGLPPLITGNWTIKAWNAWRTGQTLERLVTPSSREFIDIDGCKITRKTLKANDE